MPTDLTVILEHRPGELARLGEITGEAGVTIHGLAAFTGEGRGVVHVLLDGRIVATGGPELANTVESEGFDVFRSEVGSR